MTGASTSSPVAEPASLTRTSPFGAEARPDLALGHSAGETTRPRGPVAQTAGRVAGGACLSYRTAVPVEPGLSARVSLVVDESDTALALRSGDVAVLATPRLIALCEEAACLAVDGTLGEGHDQRGGAGPVRPPGPGPASARRSWPRPSSKRSRGAAWSSP